MLDSPCTASIPQGQVAKAHTITTLLEDIYPKEPVFLEYHNAYELLISVILSAQTTDAQVNKISRALFTRCPGPSELATAPLDVLEDLVRTTGFYRVKAKNIQGAGRHLLAFHGGEVPSTMDELVRIPGVGRKTAGVILHHIFQKPAIIVDTHFGRVLRRLGIASAQDPEKLEQEVASVLDPIHWSSLSMRANQFGRQWCKAKKPHCSTCPLKDHCGSYPLEGSI